MKGSFASEIEGRGAVREVRMRGIGLRGDKQLRIDERAQARGGPGRHDRRDGSSERGQKRQMTGTKRAGECCDGGDVVRERRKARREIVGEIGNAFLTLPKRFCCRSERP